MNYRNLNYSDPKNIRKAILKLSCCSGGGLELGAELTGGDPNAVLFLDSSSQLSTTTNLTYDSVNSKFWVGQSTGTYGGGVLENSNPGQLLISVLGATEQVHLRMSNNVTRFQQRAFFDSYIGGQSGTDTRFITSSTGNRHVFYNSTAASELLAITNSGASTFKNTDITVVPQTINALTGQTANLQNWQVNGSTLAFITPTGGAQFDGVVTFNGTNNIIRSIRTNGSGMSWYQPLTLVSNSYMFSQTSATMSGSLVSDIPAAHKVHYAVNQSGSAGYRGIWHLITETSTGSGINRFIDFEVGGVSRYYVENTGLGYYGTDVLLGSNTTLSDNAGAGAGTITNAPTAGDPTKWIAIDDNGTTRYIPTWT